MLAVQVQYWTMQENKRHNLVAEAQNRRNLEIQQYNADTNRMNATENIRHNKAVETETNRHNVVSENQGWAVITETNRHNLVMESQGWANIDVATRNAASNELNAQTNRMNAQTNRLNYGVNAMNANTRLLEYSLDSWFKAEDIRVRDKNLEISKFKAVTDYNVNSTNASTNRMNAETNAQNADTNARNADTNEWNAAVNQQKADQQNAYNQGYLNIMEEGNAIKKDANQVEREKNTVNMFNGIWRNLNESIAVQKK
jgi:hypothetical protein